MHARAKVSVIIFFYLLAGVTAFSGCSPVRLLVYLVHPAMPTMHGSIELDGVDDEIEILRDRYGMPHVFASGTRDLFFAQGFATAQDRLFQMEILRRVAYGRLAEFAGNDLYHSDLLNRTLGFGVRAKDLAHRLVEPTKGVVAAYVDGINAFIETFPGELPIEFTLLKLTPRPWSSADVLAVLLMFDWHFSYNMDDEVLYHQLRQKVGPERVMELLPRSPLRPGSLDLGLAPFLSSSLPSPPPAAPAGRVLGSEGGSNNWVVAGRRSASGAPVLANDHHIGSALLPSLSYAIHLHSPELELFGISAPGVPGILAGHNGHIAFGNTNNGADVQDLYVETFHPDDPLKYRFRGQWLDASAREEKIRVLDGRAKGGLREETVLVRETHHGPVVTPALEGIDVPMSVRWSVFDVDGPIDMSGFLMARDINEFREGLRGLLTAPMNMVFADVHGNIGYQCVGPIPVRTGGHGQFPADGGAGKNEWAGTIPFEELPYVLNPESGYVVTANNRVVGEDFPHFLTDKWAPPYRRDRIAELIEAEPLHSASTFERIQFDTKSIRADRVNANLVDFLETAGIERYEIPLRYLSGWDGTCGAADVAPTIYHAWYAEVSLRVFSDELGPGLATLYVGNWYASMERLLELLEDDSDWIDDTTTPGREGTAELFTASMDAALEKLERELGRNPDRWTWGRVHTIEFKHPAAASSAAARKLFNKGPYPMGGDGETVNRAAYIFDERYHVDHIASMRIIIDMADPAHMRGVVSTGESGRLRSPHYGDQIEPWLVGPLPVWSADRAEIEEELEGRLVITPKGSE